MSKGEGLIVVQEELPIQDPLLPSSCESFNTYLLRLNRCCCIDKLHSEETT
jgi:hypothetical protein